jgi:RHH-type rel operon transcriptional repressor/antitoxin RelB
MLSIRLPAEIERRLEELARRTGRTKTYYARAAILEHLDDLEDVHLADRRYAALIAGKSQATSLDDVECALGQAD